MEREVPDEELWRCLASLGLADLVRARGGLDAELVDRGMNLSEGQRYRLSLARGVLSDRPVLLLDEPFAALDEDSVACVVEAIETERGEGRAILLSTHVMPRGLEPSELISLS